MPLKISLLSQIHQALARTHVLNESLQAALQILYKSYRIRSGAVFLDREGDGKLEMIESIGYQKDLAKVHYTAGEGLIGKVFQSGNPIIVPQISKEPMFLNRTGSLDASGDKEQSFICVPIALDFKILGVLAINLGFQARRDYDMTRKFFELVATALIHPIRLQQILTSSRKDLLEENVLLKQKLQEEHSFHNIIGNSHEMREVYAMVTQVARSNTTALIRGESGTGKELIAQAIHYNSQRNVKPFIRVNCAAIPETLIESEFFGHERGAFTGAHAPKKGKFELADGGTIFLDEVGDLSPMTQVKLLRVLQEQEFERVGGTKTMRVDVRVVAATNANLENLISSGKFREDLYYRLNVFSILLPPLRERKTDILLLADHFMIKYARQQGKSVRRISTPAIDMLVRYHWPGNVRELENVVERAVVVCEDQVIHSYHLPPTLQTAESSDTVTHVSLDKAVASYEKELIQDALKSTRGNRAQAARLLHTTERIIGYKISKYTIDPERFKG